MAKQLLSDEIIQHIQDGYYADHEQDLTEDQIHQLSEEQLHYYQKQGKEYQAEQKKKHRLIVGGLIAAVVIVVAVVAVFAFALNSDNNLYDPDNPPATTTESTGTPGVLEPSQSNTKAGAKDDAAQ